MWTVPEYVVRRSSLGSILLGVKLGASRRVGELLRSRKGKSRLGRRERVSDFNVPTSPIESCIGAACGKRTSTRARIRQWPAREGEAHLRRRWTLQKPQTQTLLPPCETEEKTRGLTRSFNRDLSSACHLVYGYHDVAFKYDACTRIYAAEIDEVHR